MTLVKLDHLPNFRGENQKSLKPPTRYSHVSCPQNKIAHSHKNLVKKQARTSFNA